MADPLQFDGGRHTTCLRAVSLEGLLNELQLPNKPQEAGVEHKEAACQSSAEDCSAWIPNHYFLLQARFVNSRE